MFRSLNAATSAVNFNVTVPIVIGGQIPPASAVPGYATNTVDYTLTATDSVTIEATTSQTTIDLTILRDHLVEGTEIVAVQLQYPTGAVNYEINAPTQSATLDIEDNDSWQWVWPEDGGITIGPVTIDPDLGDYWGVPPWDSQFTADADISTSSDGITAVVNARWLHYADSYIPFYVVTYDESLSRNLALDFNYVDTTGNIYVVSGSGVGGTSEVGDAHAEISYEYTIDNSDPYRKEVHIRLVLLAAVSGSYTK